MFQFVIFLLILPHFLLLFLPASLYFLFVFLIPLRHTPHPRHNPNIEFISLIIPLWILFYIRQPFLDFSRRLCINSIDPAILFIIGIPTGNIRHPQPSPKLLCIPPKPLDGFLLPLIILRILIRHIRFQLIPLPPRLIIPDTPRPHLQIQLIA